MNFSYVLTVTALALSSMWAQAQTTLNTVPEGVLTLDLPNSTSSTLRYFSLPLTADPVYSGAVSAISSSPAGNGTDTIAVTVDAQHPAPFVNAATGVQLANLVDPSVPYFVKFLSGQQAGRVIKVTANTSSSLTLDTSDNTANIVDLTTTTGFAVAVGDTFEVFPACTLASLFGDNSTGNPLVLTGAASVLNADSVSIYNPAAVKFQTFFFSTTSGHWQLLGSAASANNTVIYPYSALAINRRANQPSLSIAPMAYESQIAASGGTATNTLVPTSRVAEVAIITKTPSAGLLLYSSTCYPVDMTFNQLSLGSQWNKGTSAINSDTISIYNGTTFRFDTYFLSSTSNTWQKFGVSGDQGTTVIPAGTALLIKHRNAPAFLTSSMPYSLN